MNRYRLSVAFFLMVALPVLAEEPTSSEELIPLKVGNRWTYRVNGKEKIFVSAVRREKVGEVLCMRLEARGKAEGFSWEHVAQRPDGFFRYREEGIELEPALNFCKLPLKKGDSWKATYKIGGKTGTMRYDVDTDSVTVPAGNYTTWLINAEGGDENHKVKFQSWYAPKVGLVKQTIEDGKKAWNLELELEKFETNDLRK